MFFFLLTKHSFFDFVPCGKTVFSSFCTVWRKPLTQAARLAYVVLLSFFWYTDDIPCEDNALLTCSLGQKQTDRLCQVFGFKHQSAYLIVRVFSHPCFATPFTHPLFLFFFFFPLFISCLEEKGSCNPIERHWSLSTASADKPASHSALAGSMGNRETRSSLAGSQQSLPAPSGPTQLSTLN